MRSRAEAGDAKAQLLLGHAYNFGLGIRKKESETVKWYQKAAEQGNGDAQYFSCEAYIFGHGVGKDENQAVNWCLRAAEQGHVLAQVNLANIYHEQKNYSEAARWASKAAEGGDPFAQYTLCLWYAEGDGMPQDHVTAYMWILLARAERCGQPPELCVEREPHLDALTAGLQRIEAAHLSAEQTAEARRKASEWLLAHHREPLPPEETETQKATFLVSHYHAKAAVFGGRFAGADHLDYCFGALTIGKGKIRYASRNRDDGFEVSPGQVKRVDKFEPSELSGIDYEEVYIRLQNGKNYTFVLLNSEMQPQPAGALFDALNQAVHPAPGS